jgi:hypothetical protein
LREILTSNCGLAIADIKKYTHTHLCFLPNYAQESLEIRNRTTVTYLSQDQDNKRKKPEQSTGSKDNKRSRNKGNRLDTTKASKVKNTRQTGKRHRSRMKIKCKSKKRRMTYKKERFKAKSTTSNVYRTVLLRENVTEPWTAVDRGRSGGRFLPGKSCTSGKTVYIPLK